MQNHNGAKRQVLSTTGFLKISHSLGQITVSIERARAAIAHYKDMLVEQKATELAHIDSTLIDALNTTRVARSAFRHF